ncbi:hypothetical protein TNCV_4618181 [Trichonephila clavipes]|nr:hypothetical protein TNCV_4618181 [Trichonephila clavipes]
MATGHSLPQINHSVQGGTQGGSHTMNSFQTSFGSTCSLMMGVSVSGGTEENTRSLLAFEIVILVLLWYGQPLGMRHEPLVPSSVI